MTIRCTKTNTTFKIQPTTPPEFCAAIGLDFIRSLDTHFFEAEAEGIKFLFEIIDETKGSILC